MSKSQKDLPSVKWFDGFTKLMLSVMFVILIFIFVSGKYMDAHKMGAGGTDDLVNSMASKVSDTVHHPFIELPGDAQLGAFSVANFFAGLIVGHHWEKLFGKGRPKEEPDQDKQAE
jgi:cobalt/nickel transport protein